VNHRTNMKFWKETSLHTMLTPPQDIAASTLGRFIFGRSSPVFNRITGNAQGFAVLREIGGLLAVVFYRPQAISIMKTSQQLVRQRHHSQMLPHLLRVVLLF